MPYQKYLAICCETLHRAGSIYTVLCSVLAVRRKATAKLLLFFDIAKLFRVFFAAMVFIQFFVVLLYRLFAVSYAGAIVLSMLVTTPAIVLSLQPYSDKAHILHTFTRAYGRVNYMVYGLGRKKSAAQYAPLSLEELTYDATPARQFQTLRQARLLYVPTQLPQDLRRQTVAMFVAEILYRTLRHPMEDTVLFDYLTSVVQELDTTPQPENLHIRFLVGLAALMGFGIDEEIHPELVQVPNSRSERQQQLQALCNYFAEQIDDWQSPRSLDVLMELFD